MEKIGCTTPFGPYKDNICGNQTFGTNAIQLFLELEKKYKSICKMPCKYLSLMYFKTREHGPKTKVNDKYDKDTQLVLQFESKIESTTAYYQYPMLSLIAEIGGYVGLFLGFSVYQIAEVFDFIISL